MRKPGGRCLEPFFTTKGERGTGLGLAMVYGMIQRHSAGLEIDSTPGRGTTMRLVFAAASASNLAVQPPRPAAKPSPAPAAGGRRSDAARFAAGHPARGRPHRHSDQRRPGGINAFTSACERNEPFDLVITDLGMPHIDGRKVAAAVKSLSPDTPVILLTGWGSALHHGA